MRKPAVILPPWLQCQADAAGTIQTPLPITHCCSWHWARSCYSHPEFICMGCKSQSARGFRLNDVLSSYWYKNLLGNLEENLVLIKIVMNHLMLQPDKNVEVASHPSRSNCKYSHRTGCLFSSGSIALPTGHVLQRVGSTCPTLGGWRLVKSMMCIVSTAVEANTI